MELENQINEAIEYGKTMSDWSRNANSKEFKLYNSLSKKLRNETLIAGCGTCAPEFYKYLLHINNKQIKQITMGQFKIGKTKNDTDRMIQCIDSNLILTDKNLTDDLALKLLSKNKKHIASFSEKPENWEALVDEYKEKNADEDETSHESDNSNSDAGNIAKIDAEKFATLSVKALKQFASDNKLDSKEFSRLNKTDLIAYLISKEIKPVE